ncbi:MAG: hypothetical protein HZB70_04035 [Candidatus Berkelbacteria bacterium]|nr:MAG: hypothetical protein HZB70_04035 [Candidatus Berkelbacteria bacterium]QQG51530.1 MAG: hypothetical protein HY845_03155 [Candidatus Berkelbacteria bacterium]
MEGKLRGRIDGVYRSGVTLLANTWKNHPYRFPVLLIVFLLSLTVSNSLVFFPKNEDGTRAETAKASTYQFVPTGGNLVTGTDLNANSLLAAAAEGVNTGSWKGTLADDNFHWVVDMLASGTPNVNMQLDLGTAKLTNANKLLIQTEIDMDNASHLLTVQICDWVSSTSVDAAADSQCTTGGWRSLNSQNASNADVTIGLTTSTGFQWHIFDGYFTTGTTGGSAISTPLTNFTSSDTQPIRIRYWSDSDVTCSSDCNLGIDFLRATAFVDSIYHPAGVVNQNGSGGALAGTYANAHVVGNSSTAQQSVTAGNAVYLTGAGTAGSVADYYLVFKNVKTYTGANTFYFKADYSCSAATAGLDHKFSIYNFATTTWVDLNSAVIACSVTDATNAWAENNITPSDFIDESASDEVRVRFLGDLNSTTTLRIDFAYLVLGSTNADSAQCEVTWGTGTATNCANTRDLVGPATATVFSDPAETRSNTADNDYYALDCDFNTTANECSAANIDFPVTVPVDAQVVVNHFAGRFAGDLVGTTNPDLTAQMGIRDYSGTPTSTSGPGGWTLVGASSATLTQIYTDSITALLIGTYGMQINPDDHVDTNNNEMNLRLRTTLSGLDSQDSRWEWDFAMVSIGWVVDSSHPTRDYQFAPTGDTLAAGTETARLALTAAANTGVNTGGWQGTLGDDNLHWTVNGANVVGTNFDVQLNFTTAKQNGANMMLIQTEFDTDLNIGAKIQICDWVSSTSVDAAADGNCTTGGWRSINSQDASNNDVTYTGTTAVVLQWHIFDGYFTTGTTGGSAISTPLGNFFHSSNGVKIRYFSTTQTATAIDIDFLRIQPIIDTIYHPASVTNLNGSGGALAGTYANAHVVGNTVSAQQSVTAGNAVYLTGAGTAGSIADYYLSFKNIKTYAGMNTFYFKADYSCSAATANLDTEFAIYNFTSAAWEDLTTAAIACSTTDATHAWAKNNVTMADYINGGETRIRYYGDLNSATTLRLDFAYLVVGSTNSDTADCAITFGSGTATNCSNTRDLVGPGTANRFDNAAEDESATMGTGDANAYYAFDNETTPDTTAEESTSANISFPVTQPTNSSIVGEHYASRFSGCGNTGNACGAAALTVQAAFKDYSGFNAALGGYSTLVGGTSGSSTLAYTDSITAMSIAIYGQQANPEDYIDTAGNKINMRLRPTTPGTAASNVTTVWDFAMVSIQWIEIGSIIDIQGNSSVASQTIAVAIDGLLQVGKTATGAGGGCPCAWTISSVFVGKGRAVLVWHDGASDANESSGITNYDGSGNITGMELTAHTLSVGSTDDQSKTYSELVLFDNDADEDVMYKAVSNAITVDATSTYSDDTLNILSGDTLIVGGSETLAAYNITIDGTLTSGGATAYTIQGDWVNNGTFNESTSNVTMNGTTSEDLDSGCSDTDTCTAENFYNLTINKTDGDDANDNATLTNFGVRVTNILTITDGELIQGTFNVRAEGSSAVSVAAAGKWTNISTGDVKLGGTVVNDGAIILNSNNGTQCVDAANDIAITSTSGGSVRTWSGSGTETIYNVAATDMADSTVTAYTSTLTNTTWSVGACGITISGGCFTDEGEGTGCTDDPASEIKVAVNGTPSGAVDVGVDSSWSLTGVTQPSANDILVIYINAESTETEEATTVIKYDGAGDVTNVRLYLSQLVIGADSGSTNSDQTITVADMDTTTNGYENSDDEDVLYDVTAGADLTVDAEANKSEQLYIINGDTYRPASGGGSDTSTLNLEIDTSAVVTADSNAFAIAGDWNNNGTFTANTSTVTFSGTSKTLSGTMTGSTGKFNDLVFNGLGGSWGFNAAVEAGNDFTVTNGAVTANNNNLTVGRDFTLANTAGVSYTAGSSTLNITRHFNDTGGTKFVEDTSTVNQTGTGTITVGNGGDFNNLSIGYTGFTTTLSNNNWDVFGIITLNGGSVTGGGSYINLFRGTTGSSVTFASATTLSGTQTIYHRASAGSITYTITGGNYGSWGVVPISPTGINSVIYTLGGNFTSTGFIRLEADDGVTGSTFNTSGSNYSITTPSITVAPCAPTRTGAWAIDFNDSSIALTSTVTSFALGSNCGSHTLDLDTSDVTVNGGVQFVNGTTSLTVTPGSSDFTFAPTASQTETYAPNAQSLWNMIINGANGAATIQPSSAVDVNNNFTITAGTYDTVTAQNYALTVGGNFSNSGTFTAQNANVTLDGSSTQTVSGTLTGASAFYNLIVTNVSGASASDCERTGFTPSVDFNVDVTATNNLTFTTANTRIEYDDGNTYTFNNINWNGQASGTRIFFRNSAASGTWLLKVTGTQTAVSFINVSRSDASVVGGSTIAATDGSNVNCNNNTNWDFGASTYEQADFRFGNEPEDTSTDSDYTGVPAENTAYPTNGTGDVFRLRQLIHVSGSNLSISGENFKLRFGEKTTSDCTSGVTWGDVASGSGVIRYSNGSPADGDNITSNAGDPDHAGHTKQYQDYEEANNFTNSVSAINVGEDGVWSFSLENNSAVGGKRYCFKVTKSDNTDLDTYTFYPEVIVEEELIASLDATSKDFGVVQPGGNPTDVSSTLTTSTNSSTGYVVYTWSTQAMTRGSFTIADWTGTNASPTIFGNGSFGFGYTTNDITLTGGTADRFNPGGAGAKYAGYTHVGPGDPVADRTSGPTTGQTDTVTYRLAAGGSQAAGKYQTVIVYVWSVTF